MAETLTINWDMVNSLVERKSIPKVVDNIFRSNWLQNKLWKASETLDGGSYIQQPLLFAEGPSGYWSGTDTLNTSDVDIVKSAVFSWKFAFTSATVNLEDEIKVNGPQALAKLVTVKMQTQEKSGANLIGQGIYSDGTSNIKSITGLRAAVTGSGTTYGGISKTTNAFWVSPIDSTTTTLTEQVIQQRIGRVTEGVIKPNLIVTTQDIYDILWGLLGDAKRQVNTDAGRAGYTSLAVSGVEVVVDSHCPAGYMYILNTEFLHFYSHSQYRWKFVPFATPVNQPQLRSSFMLWAGNMTCDNCRFQTALTAIAN